LSESKSKVEKLRHGARFREQLDGLHRMEEVERLRAAVVEAAMDRWQRRYEPGHDVRERAEDAACAALAKLEADHA